MGDNEEIETQRKKKTKYKTTIGGKCELRWHNTKHLFK